MALASANTTTISDIPSKSRESQREASTLHKVMLTKLRPLPFQYIWSVWHSKPSTTLKYDLSLLAYHVADIAAFYRVFNNIPWNELKLQATLHIFRAGVRPLWEDKENVEGGCWVIKVRKEGGRAVRLWEEISLMCCGGELQASVSSEHDHILGVSFSPRLCWAHISIWTKKGSNKASIKLLQEAVLTGISPELRPTSSNECYYKKHSDHEDWSKIVQPL